MCVLFIYGMIWFCLIVVSDTPNAITISTSYRRNRNSRLLALKIPSRILRINGVRAVRDYLLSDEVLANVSRHIGTKDLILTAEFPPDKSTLANTFKAVVGALNKSSGNEKSFEFVRDFLFTQLNQKDIESMWDIERPIELLQ
ncbi:39S ribosomal protein L44, mitochondrial-like [Bradysia coprophila]|uniref:39S ribosomal protein L44, mitochondrial-like n=1 Tax=Bradysia coprophila TaxID=38358 RepID=UPI00187D74DB|nr:39S ribosomal protein L44, mitochondrial-like [Bradysia coprophila]